MKRGVQRWCSETQSPQVNHLHGSDKTLPAGSKAIVTREVCVTAEAVRTECLQYRTMPGTKRYQHVIETPEPGEWEVRPFLNFSLMH